MLLPRCRRPMTRRRLFVAVVSALIIVLPSAVIPPAYAEDEDDWASYSTTTVEEATVPETGPNNPFEGVIELVGQRLAELSEETAPQPADAPVADVPTETPETPPLEDPASELPPTPSPTPTPAPTPAVEATSIPLTTTAVTESAQPAPAQETRVKSVQWLHVDGNRMVNESGETVVLRGVNVENREWFWGQRQDIQFEARAIPEATDKWGANLIPSAFVSAPVNRNEPAYMKALDDMVALAKKHNAYTLLVYRYDEPDVDQPKMPDAAAEWALVWLAKRYMDDPAVLYGLQVEPRDVSWSQLKPRFTSMVAWIHYNHPKAVIAVPGTNWGRYVHHALKDPIPGNNLIYKSHVYDRWDTIASAYRLAEVARKYPVLVGEFGVGAQSTYEDIKNLLDMMEANGISWSAWMFNDKACPCLLADAKTLTPSGFGYLVQGYLRKDGG